MTCCGKKRINFNIEAHRRAASRMSDRAALMQALPAGSEVHFEYVGATSLMVLGPVTGRRYRFEKPGAVAAVDVRDALSVAQVPNLKRIRIK